MGSKAPCVHVLFFPRGKIHGVMAGRLGMHAADNRPWIAVNVDTTKVRICHQKPMEKGGLTRMFRDVDGKASGRRFKNTCLMMRGSVAPEGRPHHFHQQCRAASPTTCHMNVFQRIVCGTTHGRWKTQYSGISGDNQASNWPQPTANSRCAPTGACASAMSSHNTQSPSLLMITMR
jgi:hypothetical protein